MGGKCQHVLLSPTELEGLDGREVSACAAFTYRVGGVRWEGNVSMCRIVEITK